MHKVESQWHIALSALREQKSASPHLPGGFTEGHEKGEIEMATRTQELYDVTLHWLDGKVDKLKGWGDSRESAAADAVNSAGYGGGALRALDYWEAKKAE